MNEYNVWKLIRAVQADPNASADSRVAAGNIRCRMNWYTLIDSINTTNTKLRCCRDCITTSADSRNYQSCHSCGLTNARYEGCGW